MPFEPKLNVLMAYPYMKADSTAFLAERQGKMRVLIDSGAFTAHSTGKPIRLDCYCAFINDLPFKPWNYFQLDVIGNPEATAANYYAMLENGFKPIPVYTRMADPDYIEEFYKTTDYIGVGGLVGAKHEARNRAIAKVIKAANGRKVHLLGCTDIKLLKAFRPYSVDSSTWSSSCRYGVVQCYMGYGKFRKVFKREMIDRPQGWFVNYCESIGMSVLDLSKQTAWINSRKLDRHHMMLSCLSWVWFVLDVERHLGVKVFLAAGELEHLRIMVEAFDFISAKYFGGGRG